MHKKAHPVKVNVWASFCAGGQGYCHIFNEKLDKHLYKRILSDNLLPSAALHFNFAPPALEQWYFLQDNDPKHTSGVVTKWLHEHGVSTIDFPPYSPDLNPIENLWGVMARAVEQHACDTMEELQDVVAAEWDKVNADYMCTRSAQHAAALRSRHRSKGMAYKVLSRLNISGHTIYINNISLLESLLVVQIQT